LANEPDSRDQRNDEERQTFPPRLLIRGNDALLESSLNNPVFESFVTRGRAVDSARRGEVGEGLGDP
jgi:hypothetical protein